MSDRLVAGNDPLERELVELGRRLSYPQVSPAFASQVSMRLGAVSVPAGARGRRGPTSLFGRPVRRAFVLAVALLLVVVAVAAAIGLGLPGLRITFGGPTPTPAVVPSRAPAASASPGSAMGLGLPISVADAAGRTGFPVLLPTDPRFGSPDAAYLIHARLALVWGPRPGIPETLEPGVSLVISEFRGDMDRGYFEKVVNTGTTLTRVTVRNAQGYWISGNPHFFFYVDPSGAPVDDTHRAVGDTLLWSAGGVTYRIESPLTRDETVALADAMR